jgi:hypothetical protein
MSEYCWRSGHIVHVALLTVKRQNESEFSTGNLEPLFYPIGRVSAKKEIIMTEYIIGVDLGGTRLRAARFDYDLNMLARDEVLTLSESVDATITRMKSFIRAMTG